MEAQAQSLLIVAGIKHFLRNVLTIAKTMPKVPMKVSDFEPFDAVAVAQVEPKDPKLNHGEVIVYKREGKYIILTGRETARRAIEEGRLQFDARLMSAQALKRCKVDSFMHPDHGKPPRTTEHTHDDSYGRPRPSAEPKPRIGKPYSDDFRNAPRMAMNHNQQPVHVPNGSPDPMQGQRRFESTSTAGSFGRPSGNEVVTQRARRIIQEGGIPAGQMDVQVVGDGHPPSTNRGLYGRNLKR